jgi:hypothetical protein
MGTTIGESRKDDPEVGVESIEFSSTLNASKGLGSNLVSLDLGIFLCKQALLSSTFEFEDLVQDLLQLFEIYFLTVPILIQDQKPSSLGIVRAHSAKEHTMSSEILDNKPGLECIT